MNLLVNFSVFHVVAAGSSAQLFVHVRCCVQSVALCLADHDVSLLPATASGNATPSPFSSLYCNQGRRETELNRIK
ncbi:hypothetical protein BDP67DRAFT_509538 [Colletotrichum lupini]|nr:hypothetical protein BDP67DRAFT_509538 [Colletotrichum lupini]